MIRTYTVVEMPGPSERRMNESVARGLALALRSGPWKRSDLEGSVDRATAGTTPWVEELVNRVLTHFGPRLPRPRYEALWRFILQDPIFDRDYRSERARATRRRSWRKTPSLRSRIFDGPDFEPGPAAAWPVAQLASPDELAQALGMSESEVDGWADAGGWLGRTPNPALQHYRRHWQRGGRSPRLIEAPKDRLKLAQLWILRNILNHVPPHEAAHGFVRGRSPKTNAMLHLHQPTLLRCDLRRFFPSIRSERVRGTFRYVGYPDYVAERLTGLCTTITPPSFLSKVRGLALEDRLNYRDRHLPQGAPTSPALANLIAFRLDLRLSGLAHRFKATYSRYADDLTFSGPLDRKSLYAMIERVADIAVDEGFELNPHKTRWAFKSQRQSVTGVVVNERAAFCRRDFDRLKAILHRCALNGPQAENRYGHPDFKAHLLGKVAYAASIDEKRGAELRRRFDRIDWTPPRKP